MSKLKLVVTRKIYDFFIGEIVKLATPKTNVQVMQTGVFLRFRGLYEFLYRHHYTSYGEVRNVYLRVMMKTYSNLFANYLSSLTKLKRRRSVLNEPNVIMKRRDINYSSASRDIFGGLIIGTTTKSIDLATNLFDLEERDQMILTYNSDPVIPTGMPANSVPVEAIVKSYLKLLADTCASEFSFLANFFREQASEPVNELASGEFSANGQLAHDQANELAHNHSDEDQLAQSQQSASPDQQSLSLDPMDRSLGDELSEPEISEQLTEPQTSEQFREPGGVDGREHQTVPQLGMPRTPQSTNSLASLLSNQPSIHSDVSLSSLPEHVVLFKRIFAPSILLITNYIKRYIRTTYDVVSITVLYNLLTANRKLLSRRGLHHIDSELRCLQDLIFVRIEAIMKSFSNLIVTCTHQAVEGTINTWLPAPFIINSAHMLNSLLRLHEYICQMDNQYGSDMLYKMLDEYIVLLQASINHPAKKLRDKVKERIFCISNYAYLVEVVGSYMFSRELSSRLGESLEPHLEGFSAEVVEEGFGELRVEFEVPDKTIERATYARQRMGETLNFFTEYPKKVASVKQQVRTTFKDATVAHAVLKRIASHLTALYTPYHAHLLTLFLENEDWLAQLPTPQDIPATFLDNK